MENRLAERGGTVIERALTVGKGRANSRLRLAQAPWPRIATNTFCPRGAQQNSRCASNGKRPLKSAPGKIDPS